MYKNTAANTRMAQLRVKCKIEALYFYLALCYVDSFVFQNPPLRKAWKR